MGHSFDPSVNTSPFYFDFCLVFACSMVVCGLETLPPELIEHIALHAWDTSLHSPNANVLSLACAGKRLAEQLLPASNPLLHARIFRSTFDCAALERRLSSDRLSAPNFAHELRRRFMAMARFRDEQPTEADMWIVLLMLFEHDSRNLSLLELHARVKNTAKQLLNKLTIPDRERARDVNSPPRWPACLLKVNLLMWILWLTATDQDKKPGAHDILVLRIVSPYCLSGFRVSTPCDNALLSSLNASQKYSLSRVEWTKFTQDIPSHDELPSMSLDYFGAPLRLLEPDFIPGATLNFMLRLQTALPVRPPPRPGSCWDTEWDRATAVDHRPIARPGVFAGVWEGSFLVSSPTFDIPHTTWTNPASLTVHGIPVIPPDDPRRGPEHAG